MKRNKHHNNQSAGVVPRHPCAGAANWVCARVISKPSQVQVQSLADALLRSLKQAPINVDYLR